MTIPFIDLKKQYQLLEKDIRANIDKILASGQFIMGPEIRQIEEELARFAGVRHAITCASGTDALLLPLMAYGIGPGDAVFAPPFTFIATAEVISLLGATPVFADIDPRTYNLDPASLRNAIETVEKEGRLKPRGIIPVDLFGLPADYDPIMALAKEKGLFVLEDAAQGFGGLYKGRRTCSLSHAGATSFFPAKPLGCYGDGGAVFTDDDALAETMMSIRIHGQGDNKYENVRIGLNARMDTIQAGILLVKLAAFPKEIEERQRVAQRYGEKLKGLATTPYVPDDCLSVWAQYSIQAEGRDAIQKALQSDGIPTAVYYPKPLHLQKAFADLGGRAGNFPVSERVSENIFSLPMHPYLENEQIDFIAEKLEKAASRGA